VTHHLAYSIFNYSLIWQLLFTLLVFKEYNQLNEFPYSRKYLVCWNFLTDGRHKKTFCAPQSFTSAFQHKLIIKTLAVKLAYSFSIIMPLLNDN